MSSKKLNVFNISISAMFLAVALLLPFLTMQIPQIGSAMCPMHIPVLLCGFFCGPLYGMIVGFIAPIFRFILFGMPPIFPSGIAMSFELAVYGLMTGFLYKVLPKKKVYIYASLIGAMLTGRAVWGVVKVVLCGLGKIEFGWTAFMAGAFTNAIPGIIFQIAVIPALVIALKKKSIAVKERTRVSEKAPWEPSACDSVVGEK